MAYRIFYDNYVDRLSRYLLVIASGSEDAMREALQATLTRVVRHIKVFSSEAAFWGWLTVLARAALIDQTRKRRRYLAFLERFRRHTGVHPTPALEFDADERLRELLNGHLARLSEADRQVIEWKYLAGRSVRDIALELQTSEKAVESRLSRIRRKLKDSVLSDLKRESTG